MDRLDPWLRTSPPLAVAFYVWHACSWLARSFSLASVIPMMDNYPRMSIVEAIADGHEPEKWQSVPQVGSGCGDSGDLSDSLRLSL